MSADISDNHGSSGDDHFSVPLGDAVNVPPVVTAPDSLAKSRFHWAAAAKQHVVRKSTRGHLATAVAVAKVQLT